MKKLMIILAMLGVLFTAGLATAADVTVTIIVPDAYVERLTACVEAKYMYQGCFDCTGLTIKQCFAKMMIQEAVKRELFQWERQQARKTATDAADSSVTKIVVNAYGE